MEKQVTSNTPPAAIFVQYTNDNAPISDEKYENFVSAFTHMGFTRFNHRTVGPDSDLYDFRWMKRYSAVCMAGFDVEDEFAERYRNTLISCARLQGIDIMDYVEDLTSLSTSEEDANHESDDVEDTSTSSNIVKSIAKLIEDLQYYIGHNSNEDDFDDDSVSCEDCPCQDCCDACDDLTEEDCDTIEDHLGVLSAAPGITLNVYGGNVFIVNSTDDLYDIIDELDD